MVVAPLAFLRWNPQSTTSSLTTRPLGSTTPTHSGSLHPSVQVGEVATVLKRMILSGALMVVLAGAPYQTMATRGLTMTVRFSPGYSGASGYGETVGQVFRMCGESRSWVIW